MRYNAVEEKGLDSKEVKKVLSSFENGSINKSCCISKLFFECGLDSNVIKGIEILGCEDNSMCYNIVKKEGLLRGIDIRNSEFIDKSSKSSGLSNEFIEFVDKWISEKKSMKLNAVVVGSCIYFKKSEVYIRKLIKKYEKLKGIEFIKSR